MHADHSTLEIAGHVLIAFLFLFRGIGSLAGWDGHVARFRSFNIPFPRVVLGLGFAVMLIGGAMVALDLRAALGAAALIVFTVAANFLYHHFWSIEDPQRKQIHLYFFCNNIAVIGGLVMVIA